ncbi:uncharacterized protein LACBIDRAFT_314103 [Laccaria bicolor S238N-H82]|uniref:Predicted protein n=1 Tax=Laccaria bicolor (strain S238N-H82 / ATCC MYA-4686) TaxID=486041 RepID=B0D1L2_LACBS|nr:uncharacterized protein LACBIDRAFT_314103 [Laccaria bicolor S238N-H82]EDR12013.1 predicted protein [Laccaria bicolor S238N-H82]|eukprot:XP_001877910.1 predicted protein [Laccaria bicolor S238N-H82]
MATIHPSRLGLVPQDPPQRRRRSPSPSPRRRSRSRSPSHRDKERERDRDRNQRKGRDERDKGRERYRDRSRGSRGRDERNDGRGRENGRGESPRRNAPEGRRGSPLYDDYRRPAPPVVEGQTPWRQPENMYPNRGGGRPSGAGSEGAGFIESRRAQREAMTVNVWPPSPKAPARDLSPKRKKSSKKSSKRARSPSSSDETSSEEEERRRRKRKEKKRSRHDKEKDKERERRRRSPSPRRHRDDDNSDEHDRRKRHRRTRSRSKSAPHPATTRSPTPKKDRSRSPTADDDDSDAWVERSPMAPPPVPTSALGGKAPPTKATQANTDQSDDEDDEEEVGPKPLQQFGTGKRFDERAYGGALLRGEGSAMAAFLQEDSEARIPRRGEIGLTSDEIAKYEDVGYVMSGSRHRRMNAVRMRKENQVISAEEKRGILKLQKEERERREAILREEFGELVNERLKAGDSRLK